MDGTEADELCAGKSVELTGYVHDYDDGKHIVRKYSHADGSEFALLGGYGDHKVGSRIRVRGVVVDGGYWAHLTTIKPDEVTVLDAAPIKPRQSSISPEAQIAQNREKGAQALEEWDEAIRQNNKDLKQSVAAKAVSHSVNNSGDVLVDVYGMPDGRFIACTTVVNPSSAPITSCDGEP